jgi:hypothetical protein
LFVRWASARCDVRVISIMALIACGSTAAITGSSAHSMYSVKQSGNLTALKAWSSPNSTPPFILNHFQSRLYCIQCVSWLAGSGNRLLPVSMNSCLALLEIFLNLQWEPLLSPAHVNGRPIFKVWAPQIRQGEEAYCSACASTNWNISRLVSPTQMMEWR